MENQESFQEEKKAKKKERFRSQEKNGEKVDKHDGTGIQRVRV